MKMEKPTLEKASKMTFNLIDSGSSSLQVKKILTDQGFSQFEIDQIIDPILENKYRKELKKSVWGTMIILLISFCCIALYYFFTNQNEKFAQDSIQNGTAVDLGNGQYLVRENHSENILMKIGISLAITGMVGIIRTYIIWKKLKNQVVLSKHS